MKHHWNSLKSLGNPRRSWTHHRKVIDNALKTKSLQIVENHRTFIEKTENHWRIIDNHEKILENLRNHWNIIENHWTTMGKSSEIMVNYWKSLSIIENHWKIMENNHAPTFFNPLSSHVWFGFASVPPKWVKYMCIRRRVFYVFGRCFWCVFGWQNRLLKFAHLPINLTGPPLNPVLLKKVVLFVLNKSGLSYIYIYIYIWSTANEVLNKCLMTN